ncbi:hypothetical protein BB560_003924 [Smittium megazygosporum]|uniref:RNA helicase n=1 Tax=Smittium megazygosporum TaxID=133381 RepID=A0A2T9ZAM4_9FUNG|nr:hypothetical protein BB560_003924 [Smittium megazygosporum]
MSHQKSLNTASPSNSPLPNFNQTQNFDSDGRLLKKQKINSQNSNTNPQQNSSYKGKADLSSQINILDTPAIQNRIPASFPNQINPPSTDQRQNEQESKIQKRREKLELWKKLKNLENKKTTIDLENAEISPQKPTPATTTSPESSQPASEKSSRRLKISQFLKAKNIDKTGTSLGTQSPPISPTTNSELKASSQTPNFPETLDKDAISHNNQKPAFNTLKLNVQSQPKVKQFGFKFGLSKPKNKIISSSKFLNDLPSSEKPSTINLQSFTQQKSKKSLLPSDFSKEDEKVSKAGLNVNENQKMDVDESEIDPLDAYMENIRSQEQQPTVTNGINHSQEISASIVSSNPDGTQDNFIDTNFGDNEDGVPEDPEDILELAAKKLKKKDFISVDHSKIQYEPFKKEFYVEPEELASLTEEQVESLRYSLDDIKIRGINPPNPVTKWTYFGLPSLSIQIIKKHGFEAPTPIQAQSIPAVLQGRDIIGVAKTGSGKTLAYILPMIRHIKAQRPLKAMEGPIAMIMAPTRELAVQIARECRIFAKPLGLRTVCSYGGSPIKDQIAELKRGAEIVVCTPGRMIDLLSANSGRVTNLKRVTFLVLDEADRMFDMGFEPQVMKIVQNVRPNRQTLLFSATFPRQMEALARKILKQPLEITVGGRSVVCSDITQIAEIVDFDEKFLRLLDILGSALFEDPETCALIFVERQESADTLFRDLLRRGYLCNSLHGGKDQSDRDQTILDFKQGVFNFLIATSVAARGLDVKRLNLVVNYDCPNHLEDYVHRVGRTGRAGNKGTAVTFITRDQGRYAIEIIKALQTSGVDVPPSLQELADDFLESVRTGEVKYYNAKASGGFGGKGLEKLDAERQVVKSIQRHTFGVEDDQSGDEGLEDPDEVQTSSESKVQKVKTLDEKSLQDAVKAAQKAAEKFLAGSLPANASTGQSVVSAVDEINAKFAQPSGGHGVVANADVHSAEFFVEIEINDYPQKARWKVTNRETLSQITETSGTAITVRGVFHQAGKPISTSTNPNNLLTASANQSNILSKFSTLPSAPSTSERKLYLRIEGNSEIGVERAKTEIRRLLMEATMQSIEHDSRQGLSGGSQYGRYSVI